MMPSSPAERRARTRLVALALCLVTVALAIAADLALAPPGLSILREDGPVESCSAAFYIVALVALARVSSVARAWPVMLAFVAMSLRELDADKRFTSEGILSIKILTYDTALWEKGLAIAVFAVIVVMLYGLARRLLRLMHGLRAGAAWAWLVLGGLVLTVVSKSIDGLGRKLAPFGVSIDPSTGRLFGQAEEVMELGIPILLLLAVLSLRGDRAT